jgi:hypothetical protein
VQPRVSIVPSSWPEKTCIRPFHPVSMTTQPHLTTGLLWRNVPFIALGVGGICPHASTSPRNNGFCVHMRQHGRSGGVRKAGSIREDHAVAADDSPRSALFSIVRKIEQTGRFGGVDHVHDRQAHLNSKRRCRNSLLAPTRRFLYTGRVERAL